MENGQVAVGVHKLHRVVAAIGIELDGDAVDTGDLIRDRGVLVVGPDRSVDGDDIAGDRDAFEYRFLVLFGDTVTAESFEPSSAALVAGREICEILVPFVGGDDLFVHDAVSIAQAKPSKNAPKTLDFALTAAGIFS
jgi:hypothetical protein